MTRLFLVLLTAFAVVSSTLVDRHAKKMEDRELWEEEEEEEDMELGEEEEEEELEFLARLYTL